MPGTLRIAASGIAATDIARIAASIDPSRVVVEATTDVEAARGVNDGTYDLMIGSCLSGQGGALSIAIATLGYDRCALVGRAGSLPSDDRIRELASSDAKAFGVTASHVDQVIPVLVRSLLESELADSSEGSSSSDSEED